MLTRGLLAYYLTKSKSGTVPNMLEKSNENLIEQRLQKWGNGELDETEDSSDLKDIK